MTYNTNNLKWSRVMTGLYVDTTNRWVITRDGYRNWTVRQLMGWGPTLSGKMFPDYDGIIYGDYHTFAEAKIGALRCVGMDLSKNAELFGGDGHGWTT